MLNIDHFKIFTDELTLIKTESFERKIGGGSPAANMMRLHFEGLTKERTICEDYNEEILYFCRSIASSPICQDGKYRVLCSHHRNNNNYIIAFTQDELNTLCKFARQECVYRENHNHSLRSRKLPDYNSMNSDYY
jgi:hypothetical protein